MKNTKASDEDRSLEEILSEVAEYQRSINYYLRKNNSLLKGISLVLWLGFVCSVIGGFVWLNSF
ncbi:MAG: hypothetical protein J6C82_04910 [Clostridia bacterium]|nr:hypothetical protein [Clostridia bacterium]